jgi:hypothetical protein
MCENFYGLTCPNKHTIQNLFEQDINCLVNDSGSKLLEINL